MWTKKILMILPCIFSHLNVFEGFFAFHFVFNGKIPIDNGLLTPWTFPLLLQCRRERYVSLQSAKLSAWNLVVSANDWRNSKQSMAFGVGVYFCVQNSCVNQGHQLISEERCSSVNKLNPLGLVDVGHNLAHAHTNKQTKVFIAGKNSKRQKEIVKEQIAWNLEVLHWLRWLDTHQNLILSKLPLEEFFVGQHKCHSRLSSNVDRNWELLHRSARGSVM